MKNLLKLDDYVLYADTDSLKLKHGYDKKVIEDYNEFVKRKIKHVSEELKIPYEKFAPKDIKGKERMLGVFDDDGHYLKFITQGAKKYAYECEVKKSKIEDIEQYRKDMEGCISYEDDEVFREIHITVSGVPKSGAKSLHCDLNNFQDDLVFEFKDTGKNLLIYTDYQEPVEIEDYLGNKCIVNDISGCCILPTTYVLSKSEEYEHLLSDESAARAIYKENVN